MEVCGFHEGSHLIFGLEQSKLRRNYLSGIRVSKELAWSDLKNSYKRTSLGPWWGTITSGVMIATLWLVFGNLFAVESYFTYLATGILLWTLVSGPLGSAPYVFASNENLIRSTSLPLWTYLSRGMLKQLFVFAHSFALIPIVVFINLGELPETAIWFVLSMPLVALNMFWLTSLIAFLSTRYRDVAPIVVSVTTVLFYLTPIFWKPDILHSGVRELFLDWNPMYYMLNLLREPWLGNQPRAIDWIVVLCMTALGGVFFRLIYRAFQHRVVFWL